MKSEMQVVGRANIGISRTTKEALNSIKHPGQSYDGLIQELFRFWKENKEGSTKLAGNAKSKRRKE